MSRKYGRVETGFWRNPKVRRLLDDPKLLLAYLFSCPHGNASGCFVLPIAYVADDMRWSTERAGSALAQLLSNGFIEREEATDLIMIIGWFDHNPIENPNVAKHVIETVKSLPAGALRNRLVASILALDNHSETVSQELAKASKYVVEPIRNMEMEPEPEMEKEPEQETEPENVRAVARRDLPTEMFEVWTEEIGDSLAHPRKLTEARRKALVSRFADSFDEDIQNWRAFLVRVRSSGFLTGGGDRGWRADLDWLLTPKHTLQILEGKFDDRQGNGKRSPAENLFLGAAQALAERERARDSGQDIDPTEPLLDSVGPAGTPKITDGRLA